MRDAFGRTLNYLRISVTDRCNLRCRYCMPPEGVPLLPHEQILSLEEILDVARTATHLGFERLRLTGGEPMLRRNLFWLVERLAALPNVRDLSMTTNGLRLPAMARPLKEAGLQRVNVSLDAVDPERYRDLTRIGNVAEVLAGIDAAEAAGLRPIKLNCVVERSKDEPDARAVAAFGRARGFEVRFIQRMDLRSGTFSVVEGGSGGLCSQCNRLRLTSNGLIKPCLFSDKAFSVRQLGARYALEQACAEKPESGVCCRGDPMVRIGG
jgi:cyclic pyranopterin phosphate synthase